MQTLFSPEDSLETRPLASARLVKSLSKNLDSGLIYVSMVAWAVEVWPMHGLRKDPSNIALFGYPSWLLGPRLPGGAIPAARGLIRQE